MAEKGYFVWYELMTTDMKAAEAFYSKVVGWDAADAGMPEVGAHAFRALLAALRIPALFVRHRQHCRHAPQLDTGRARLELRPRANEALLHESQFVIAKCFVEVIAGKDDGHGNYAVATSH